MEKRGQFYLMAALVIIVLIIGFAAVSNYSRTQEYTRAYDIGQELEIESAQVLSYGIYNENIGIEQMENLLDGFIEEYSKIGNLQELYFIFGNAQNITFMGYQQLNETVLVDVGINEGEYSPLEIRKQQVEYQGFEEGALDIETISIKIHYGDEINEFGFELNPGENFYFILSQVIEGQKYVIYG
ncbi:MAG: hypothetical protein PVJ67_00345 [Candidatus Pacearchaeota archaeon]|jgi:hypothetical protein